VANSEDDSGDAIRAAVRAAMAAGPGAEVVFEAGTYRVQAEGQRGYCFPVRQAANLVVRGAGKATKIVITNPAVGAFSFGICQQVSIRDLTIDYDPPPFCQGTIRSVDEKVRRELFGELERALGVARALGGDFELRIEEGYPATLNDQQVASLIRQVAIDLLGADCLHPPEPGMGAEDFGLLANLAPGAMFDLGAQGEGGRREAHSPTFDIDERALPIGAAILAETACRCLASWRKLTN